MKQPSQEVYCIFTQELLLLHKVATVRNFLFTPESGFYLAEDNFVRGQWLPSFMST